MSSTLTKQQVDKLANAIVYLSDRVSELNKTKILKLLFFIEEACVSKYGHPFFGVDFKIWVRGPVLEDIYYDLERDNPVLLKDYIKRAPYDKQLFIANAPFNDDEFSENDIEIMDCVVQFARHKNANDLVMFSHNKDSIWRRSAIQYGIYDDLIKEKITTTNYLVNFSFLIDENPFLKERYENAIENLEFTKSLKG